MDDSWAATTGFRERWEITCDPESGVFSRAFTTLPPAGMEAEGGKLNVGLRPDTGGGLRPWTPTQGWAPKGTQWLSVGMGARVQWEARLVPALTLSVRKSFIHSDASGQQTEAVHPESVTTDALATGQAELLVVWPVIAGAGTSTLSFNAVGEMSVDYEEVPGVAAQFSGAATPLEFVLTATPTQRREAPPRSRVTSYRAIDAATEALRDSTALVMGMDSSASQWSRVRRASPSPSEPTTTSRGPSEPGRAETDTSPSPARPTTVKPILDACRRARFRFVAMATGMRAAAPAELFHAAAVMEADLRAGITTP